MQDELYYFVLIKWPIVESMLFSYVKKEKIIFTSLRETLQSAYLASCLKILLQ